MNHEETVKKVLSSTNNSGTLKSRESNTVEFKESFNKNNTAKYAKTMAAYSNNRGGYIIFGVKNRPRKIVGLKNDNFENMSQEQFSESINSLFAPAMNWDCGTIEFPENDGETALKIGWIYTAEAEDKPVIAQKSNDGEKINSGDVYYRYRARSEKIKSSEMNRIIEERITKERNRLLKLFEVIRESKTTLLGIVDYSKGKISTPHGVDVALNRKLVTEILKKAKFIKEGSFNETNGLPVIKVTGNIDLAEEVPVPEGNPDETHPYIQKQLSEKLGIDRATLYSLIWHYKMKGKKRFHLEITTSKSGKIHKFSDHACQFLQEKLNSLKSVDGELEKIREAYKNHLKSMNSGRK